MAALAHLYWLQDRFEAGESILASALEKARTVADNELLARLLYTAGTLKFGRGEYHQALPMHQEALRVAQADGDLAGEALARHGLCETRYFVGPLDQALEEGQRANELFRSLGQRPMVYHNLYMVGYVLLFKGRIREAIQAMDEAVEGCREVGNRRDEGFALGRTIVRFPAGELAGALADMKEATRIALDIQTPRLELAIRGFGSTLLAELRRFDLVESEIRHGFELAGRLQSKFGIPRLSAMSGWLALHRGERDRAIELFADSHAAADGVMLDLIQNSQVELLAWEEAGDPERIHHVATRLQREAADDSPLYTGWGEFGSLVADVLLGRWDGVLERARSLAERARTWGDRMLEWRVVRIASLALREVGRWWESEIERVRAAAVIRAAAAGLDEDLRSPFFARPDVSEVLGAGSSLVAELSIESLEALKPPRQVSLQDGQAVFRRGDLGSTVYIVASGTVRISADQDDGTEAVLGRVGPQEVFGEVALLDGGPRTADAVAEGPTVVFEFQREPFLRLLQAQPAVAGRMLSLLNDRLAQSMRAPQPDENGDVAARLAGAIQEVARSEDRGGTVIEILPVYLRDGEIWWLRPAGSPSLVVEGDTSGHPGDMVVSALAGYGLQAAAVHSTSWRFDRGRLVVTYLAVLDDAGRSIEGFQAAEVRRRELARGTAFGPPPAIEIDHVVEHALRHLAWLSRDDPAIRGLLHRGWFRALEPYEPEPFRSLSDPDAAGREEQQR